MTGTCVKCKKPTMRGEICSVCCVDRSKKYKHQCLGGCGKEVRLWVMRCGACKESERWEPDKAARLAKGSKKRRGGRDE